MTRKHNHYFKSVSHLSEIDVYRVLDLFAVTNPSIQHATKKLLCAGGRGTKDFEKDLREARDSIERALQMIAEDRSQISEPLSLVPLSACTCFERDCACLQA
jgi:hypothetical protein